jgi:hypothetical protein
MNKVNTNIIHACEYSSQPYIKYVCGIWVTPAWEGEFEPIDPTFFQNGIYVGDNYELYTFHKEKVTCEECLNIMRG